MNPPLGGVPPESVHVPAGRGERLRSRLQGNPLRRQPATQHRVLRHGVRESPGQLLQRNDRAIRSAGTRLLRRPRASRSMAVSRPASTSRWASAPAPTTRSTRRSRTASAARFRPGIGRSRRQSRHVPGRHLGPKPGRAGVASLTVSAGRVSAVRPSSPAALASTMTWIDGTDSAKNPGDELSTIADRYRFDLRWLDAAERQLGSRALRQRSHR